MDVRGDQSRGAICQQRVFIPAARPIAAGGGINAPVRHGGRMCGAVCGLRAPPATVLPLPSPLAAPAANGGRLLPLCTTNVPLVKAMCAQIGKENIRLPVSVIRMPVNS